MGFIRFRKNPEKEELFAIEIIKQEKEGIVNADTLYRYYTGELTAKDTLEKTMENFVQGLIDYSQSQNDNISELERKLRKGE